MMNNSILQLYGSTTQPHTASSNQQSATNHMTSSADHVTSHPHKQEASSEEKSLTTETLVPPSEMQHPLIAVPEDSTADPGLKLDSVSVCGPNSDQEGKREARMKRGLRSLDEVADGSRPKRKRVKAKSEKSASASTPSDIHGERKSKQGIYNYCWYVHYDTLFPVLCEWVGYLDSLDLVTERSSTGRKAYFKTSGMLRALCGASSAKLLTPSSSAKLNG